MNVEIGTQAMQFSEKEYINGISLQGMGMQHVVHVIPKVYSRWCAGHVTSSGWAPGNANDPKVKIEDV